MKTISIVVPVYNEQSVLAELLQRLERAAAALPADNVELIIVDDASSDESPKILNKYTPSGVKFIYRSLDVKGGKSKALAEGFANASGQIILLIDADLQNDPDNFPAMIALLEAGSDVVTGWRVQRHDDLLKCVVSKVYNAIINMISGMHLHDHNCGIKAIRSEWLLKIDLHSEWHRFLTVLIYDAGGKVVEMKVRHYPRRHGKSRYGIERYFRFAADLVAFIVRRRPVRPQENKSV